MVTPRRRINIELLLGISATFLSLAALVVSIFQTKIAREQQQKTVLPYLQIRHEIENNALDIFLENEGVGPAFIKSIKISYGPLNQNNYGKFILSMIDDFKVDLNAISDSELTEAKYDSIRKVNNKVNIAHDWMTGGKNGASIYAGSAIKEGDSRIIYHFNQNGMNGGPFVERMRQLIADSTYQIKIVYSDVYDNCWQLVHTKNRNKVLPLKECPD